MKIPSIRDIFNYCRSVLQGKPDNEALFEATIEKLKESLKNNFKEQNCTLKKEKHALINNCYNVGILDSESSSELYSPLVSIYLSHFSDEPDKVYIVDEFQNYDKKGTIKWCSLQGDNATQLIEEAINKSIKDARAYHKELKRPPRNPDVTP